MTEILFHPRHVADALDRFDALEGVAAFAAFEVTDTKAADYIPPEALVRFLRRCRSDPNAKLERATAAALVRFTGRWVARRYAGLTHADRDDMAQKLLAHVSAQVAARTTIDWWEITFHRNLERAAADHYPGLFDLPSDALRVDADTQDQVIHDDGEQAGELVANAVRHARLAEILTPRELELFWPLFMSPVPLDSKKAAVDLVRLLGIPGGTLAGIKTGIKKKLKAASVENAL